MMPISAVAPATPGMGTAMNKPMVGYRCWLVESGADGFRLSGVMTHSPWTSTPGAWTEACCLPPRASTADRSSRHPAACVPEPDCSCGLHAYHSLALGGFEPQPEPSRLWDERLGLAWGMVLGAGRIVISEDGWRAQLARPVALIGGSGLECHIRDVSERLDIPIVLLPEVERLAATRLRTSA